MIWKSLSIVLILALGIAMYVLLPSMASTELLDNDIKIVGIPTDKDTTNIIVVHGIGDHCIGYADTLITSFIKGLSREKKLNIQKYTGKYVEYSRTGYAKKIALNKIILASNKIIVASNKEIAALNKKIAASIENGETSIEIGEALYQKEVEVEWVTQPLIFPPRKGNCEIDKSNQDVIASLIDLGEDAVDGHRYLDSDEVNRVFKHGSYVDSQEKMCEFLHLSKTKKGDVKTDCFELYVNKNYIKKDPKYPDNAQYITGFVRKITFNTTSLNEVNIFEVTWSPATRWIKTALHAPEIQNGRKSQAPINRLVKTQIINSAIADAVAYLSDSGILINFNVLQAFCLALQDSIVIEERVDDKDNKFACDKDNLKAVDYDNYADKNDTILISHSLGTRILFDTLGLVSYGHPEADVDGRKQPDLLRIMYEKFNKIHAAIPDQYAEQSTAVSKSFSDLLDLSIPAFIDSIHSMVVFTNQIPLLAANITSPLKPNHLEDGDVAKIDFGEGFSNILRMRTNPQPLQIVSFHDPDDMLSYNLKCWFRTSVLKHDDDVRKDIETVVTARSIENGTEEDEERRKIRGTMFDSCSLNETDKYYEKNKKILKRLWATQKRFDLVDASVRLKGGKLFGLLAWPHDVHSNYFTDTDVHNWLISGR